jgi:integrase
MAKRANGDGSIYYDKSKKLWYGALGDVKTKGCKTRTEARAALKELQQERDAGVNLAERPTVKEFGDWWLEHDVKRDRKAKTHSGYAYTLRHYAYPHIGDELVKAVTYARIKAMQNALEDAGLSPSTVRTVIIRVRQLLDAAIDYNYIARNPIPARRLPKLGASTKRALSAEEAAALIEAAQGYQNSAIYHLLLGLGLRRGEALGLLWRDLDWEQRTITITQQVLEVDGKLVIEPSTKTESSRRTLPLNDRQIALLRQQWEALQDARRRFDAEWKEHGLIFPSEKGTPWFPGNLDRQFTAVKRRAKITRCSLHELRHTFATLLKDLAVETSIIGALLGHSAEDITGHYAKVRLARMREALDLLAPLLQRAA